MESAVCDLIDVDAWLIRKFWLADGAELMMDLLPKIDRTTMLKRTHLPG